MDAIAPPFVVHPGGRPAHEEGVPGHEIQELWFAIARRPWTSLVLVPADTGTSAAELARALADVGTRLRDTPVTAIVAGAIDYGTARLLSDLHHVVAERGPQPRSTVEVKRRVVDVAEAGAGGSSGTSRIVPPQPVHDAHLIAPYARVIVAIQPVVEQPLGVAIAQAADGVIVCVEPGVTRMKSARRTVELIGRDRVLGAFLIH